MWTYNVLKCFWGNKIKGVAECFCNINLFTKNMFPHYKMLQNMIILLFYDFIVMWMFIQSSIHWHIKKFSLFKSYFLVSEKRLLIFSIYIYVPMFEKRYIVTYILVPDFPFCLNITCFFHSSTHTDNNNNNSYTSKYTSILI